MTIGTLKSVSQYKEQNVTKINVLFQLWVEWFNILWQYRCHIYPDEVTIMMVILFNGVN